MEKTNFRGQIYENVMPQKIDVTDRKILYLLSRNARLSNTVIAKTLKLKREVVSYRIKKMQEKEVINGFLTLLNLRRMGFLVHSLFIKLKTLTWEMNIINDLAKINGVTNLQNCSGRFDLHIQTATKNLEEFESIVNTILSNHSTLIQEYSIFTFLQEEFTNRGLLLHDHISEAKYLDQITETKGTSFQKYFNKVKPTEGSFVLEEKEKMILTILKHDSRLTIREISEKVALSPRTTEKKIKKLIQEGVIVGFIPIISFTHFGWQWNILFLQLNNLNELKFITYLRNHPNIFWYKKFVGRWNFLISIFAENHSRFHDVLNELRTEFSENIYSFDSIILFNQFKLDQRIE